MVRACRHDTRSGSVEGDPRDIATMTFELGEKLPASRIPDLRDVLAFGDRCELRTVGAECSRRERACADLEWHADLTRRRVPELGGSVPAGSEDLRTVRAKRRHTH